MARNGGVGVRVGAFLLAVAASVAAIWSGLRLIDYQRLQTVVLPSNAIAPVEGQAFSFDVALDLVSDEKQSFGSPIRLREGDRDLGPAHMPQAFIAQGGNGSFRHDEQRVVFSSSDGSDPRTNDRTYTIEYPRRLPAILAILAGATALLASVLVWGLGAILPGLKGFPSRQAAWSAVYFVVLLGFAGEFTGRLALARFFDSRGQLARAMHDQAFGFGQQADIGWNSLQYVTHPYLIYTLNPATYRSHPGEVNADYAIRREEPLLPRDEVRFRILVLGGSTTHDSQILDEQSTWVHRLESKLRDEYGPNIDVINGGVGGYTTYENLIHYVTLLTHVQPDLVLTYVGINDVHPRLFTEMRRDYLHYNQGRRLDDLVLHADKTWWHRYAPYRYCMVSQRVNELIETGAGIVRTPYPPLETWEENLAANSPQFFCDALRNLLLLARAQGRQVGLIPQYFTVRNETDRIFAIGVEQNNEASAAMARSLDVPVLDSPIRPETFVSTDTNDSCHFNHVGARKMADAVYSDLAKAGLLDRLATLRR